MKIIRMTGDMPPCCSFEIGFDSSCLIGSGSILPGTCIQVNDHGNGTVTINNTMTLTAGPGIAISGDCAKTISTTGVETGIEEGDCISFDVDGNTTTINSTVNVTGGNGIIVTKSDCDYIVSLAGGLGDPKTSVRFVCDIECVQGTDGNWSLQVKYGTLELPTAILSSYTSECGGSGSGSGSGGSGGGGGGGEVGGSITYESIDCDSHTPHFAFTVNFVPSGAAYFVITVTGDKGSSATVGPSYDHEETPGQTYWGALVDGWGDPQPGECFTFSAQWYDSDDNPVGDPITWEACCD